MVAHPRAFKAHVDSITTQKGLKMASSLDAIKKQLECSICLRIIDTPKILESCNHVFCKKCISDLVQSNEKTSFPCPECRVACTLPADGVDGLKDEFRVAKLIEILNASETTSSEKTVLLCSSCQNNVQADSVCDFCDLDLCPKCRREHLKETKETGDHIVYDLCVKHKRRKKHCCCKCNVLICVQCLKTNHSEEEHDTKPYKEFATAQVNYLENEVKRISAAAKSTKDRLLKADEHLAGARSKVESKKKEIIEQSNVAIKPLTCQIYDVRQEIEKLQIRLEKLESKKAAHIEYMEAKIRAIDSEKVDSFDIEPQKLAMAEKVKQIDSTKKQLKRLKEKYWLGIGHHQEIIDCKRGMGEIVSTLGNLEETMGAIEQVCQMAEAAGDVKVTPEVGTSSKHVLTFAEVAELNVDIPSPTLSTNEGTSTQSTWVPMQEWRFDTDGPCCVYKVVGLPKGLAVLGGTSDTHPSKIFYFPSSIQNVFAEITQGVSPSKDMALNSSGDLVLLRAEEPYLRVFVATWDYQWYKPIPSPKAITKPRTIACASDKIIVLDGVQPNVTLFVLNQKGQALHCLQDSHHGRLAYSELTQIIYISIPGSDTFKLSGTALSPTGKKLELPTGLHVRDICCVEDGNIAVAGTAPWSSDRLGRVVVCLLNSNLNQTHFIADIVDGSGEPVFVNEKTEKIRIDVREKILIIACGAKMLFYQMV